jgi:trypsin
MRYTARLQDPDERDQIAEYWSEERMAAATPIKLPTISPEDAERLGLPPPPREAVRGEPTQDGQPFQPDTGDRPYRSCGALFFKDPSGQDCWGSASFVGADGILLTAGHCLYDHDAGAWNTNFYFVRVYEKTGSGTNGQRFDIAQMNVPDQWKDNGNVAFDYAFCKVTKPSDWEEHLGLLTGTVSPHVTVVGYPDNFGGGDRMYAVTSKATGPVLALVYTPDNPFQHGASGGPWIANASKDSGDDRNMANCLTSFGIDGEQGVYGPYFDDATQQLFERTRG